jgi:ribosome assembly protein 1
VRVEELFLLMGRGLEPLAQVPAGNVFGIGGARLEQALLKTATLSSSLACPSSRGVQFGHPIMRVAVEPELPGELPVLAEGLRAST